MSANTAHSLKPGLLVYMTKILKGEKLVKRAEELGIDISGSLVTQNISGRHKQADEHEIQHRVIEAERSIRESRMWWLAVLSAIASIISAIVALIAVTT